MNLKEQLAAKQAALTALKSRIEADDADAIAEGEAISAEIADLNARIAQAEAKASLLAQMKSESGVQVKTNSKARSLAGALIQVRDGIQKGSKHFSISTPYLVKDGEGAVVDADEPAAGDGDETVTVDPITAMSFDTMNRTVPALKGRTPVASLMGAYTISGDTYTYLVKNPFTGEIQKVEEGGKKPFVKTGYDKKTVTIEKWAAYTKYTTETVWDNAFLVSAYQNEMLLELGKTEDKAIIDAILADTDVVDDIEYDATEDLGMIEAIMRARAAIAQNTAYTADAVIINPADLVEIELAKDSNGRYYGESFFAGSPDQPKIWGMRIFESAYVPEGTVLVGAFKNAVKVVRNGGVMAAATNTNEDDFVNNLITYLVEERFATAVEVPAAIYKITAEA